MKKNEIYEGMVTELKFPNKGKVIVENEEETVMVKNTFLVTVVREVLEIAGTKSPVSSC